MMAQFRILTGPAHQYDKVNVSDGHKGHTS